MRYVAYYRVSTVKQGTSGLGLEAQRKAVLAHIKEAPLVAEYTEVESGKKNNRPQLTEAIAHAKKAEAILVIAKLDRLARNVAFIASLMEAGVDFVACDQPTANKFTIHIFAALAEQEAQMISERTKAALQVRKQQGIKLGKPENLTGEAIAKGLKARQDNARQNGDNEKATALIMALKGHGMSYNKIAAQLNENGFRSRRGGKFDHSQVRNLYLRQLSNTIPKGEQQEFKFKPTGGPISSSSEVLVAALYDWQNGHAPSQPIHQFAADFVRENLLAMPVTQPLPNEWTAWCFNHRTKENLLRRLDFVSQAQEQGINPWEWADQVSNLCGWLYYTRLGGEWTAADRSLAAKMAY